MGGKVRKYMVNHYGRFPSAKKDGPLMEDATLLDKKTKKAALKTASSVVCLRSFSGDNQLFICSGIIMECGGPLDCHSAIILTSTTLLRCMSGAAKVADNVKIHVHLLGDIFWEGQVLAFDFHYNVALIKITPEVPLPSASVRYIDDTVAVGTKIFQDSEGTSTRFSLFPGEMVLALGRSFEEPYDIMMAAGEFSGLRGISNFRSETHFNCKELLKASCKITKNGIGGPLINCLGEVIGINFYDSSFTPFLPINIAYRCYESLKSSGCTPHPWLGLEAIDLYMEKLEKLERLNLKFPDVIKGAIIQKVISESPADLAGLCSDDVIISCDGTPVGSCLELTEAIWDKEGKPVELVVLRGSTGEQLNLIAKDVRTNPVKYRWSIPEKRLVRIHPLL